MNKITYIFAILIFVSSLFISCEKKNEETTPTEVGIAVEVTNPTTKLAKTLQFKGKIKASNSTSIRTRVSSFVEEVYVKTGDEVKQGELLIKLNNADLQAKKAQVEAQIQQIDAQLNQTQRDVERYRNLFAKQSISEKELENIELQLTSVEAQKSAALQQMQEVNSELKYVEIKAPFDGVITSKNVQKGDLANPQQAMLQLEGKTGYEIEVSVSERDIANFQQNDSAFVYVDQLETALQAIVTEVSSSSATTGGQYKVKANILADNQPLFAGMNASLQINTNTKSQGIFIPQSAIIRRGELKGLYVVSQQNTALLRWIRVGTQIGNQVEIISGLNAEEKVITTSSSKLYNGIKVSFK